MAKRIDKDMMVVTMYIPRTWHEKLLIHAAQRSMTRNEIYRESLKFYIEIKNL